MSDLFFSRGGGARPPRPVWIRLCTHTHTVRSQKKVQFRQWRPLNLHKHKYNWSMTSKLRFKQVAKATVLTRWCSSRASSSSTLTDDSSRSWPPFDQLRNEKTKKEDYSTQYLQTSRYCAIKSLREEKRMVDQKQLLGSQRCEPVYVRARVCVRVCAGKRERERER